ncbi:MAG: hypothetical protein KF819_28935 [Labilithrix sp.]|nr:hypothetical protein [Labilithrix sp.]
MADRSWEYLLPTGERLEVRLELETLTESVYLGPRLVSRSPQGGKADGHVVPLHGEGPFRGGSAARVAFVHEPPSCEVSIDGRILEPSLIPPVAQPPDRPPDAEIVVVREAPRRGRLFAGIILVVLGVPAIVFFVLQAAEKARVSPPLDVVETTPNGALEIRFSSALDVSVVEAPTPGPGPRLVAADRRDRVNVVTIDRRGRDQRVVMVVDPRPTTTDLGQLHDLLATVEPHAWPPADGKILSRERRAGLCRAADAQSTELRVDVRGTKMRVWSCSFLAAGKGYRFATYIREADASDERILREIVDAALPL